MRIFQKISNVFWLHTQNPRRFEWFVVVVENFDEYIDDFHVFLFRNVFFPK